MRRLSNINLCFLCLIFSLILAFPNLLSNPEPVYILPEENPERFQPHLVERLQSIDDLLSYGDSIATVKNVSNRSLGYAEIMVNLVKDRFYHGYSYYNFNDNWIAALSGIFIWNHLSAVVLPDDILKYPMAACSQQSIVLAECFKRNDIAYRKIGFDDHFALEAKIEGMWYYFDANKELNLTKVKRASFAALFASNEFYNLFSNSMNKEEVAVSLANPFYGNTNEKLAPVASVFHQVTWVISKFIFLVPLAVLFWALFYRRNTPIKN